MVNYYSGTKELTVKSYMVRHLRTYLKRPWDITPVSYIIKPGSARDERQRFLAEWQVMRGKCANTWIVKPARQNKAKGIKVMEDAAAILKYIDTQKEDRFEYVVQKYLERPFLIHGRKFDIRTWVVVGPDYDVWLWRDGSRPRVPPTQGALGGAAAHGGAGRHSPSVQAL